MYLSRKYSKIVQSSCFLLLALSLTACFNSSSSSKKAADTLVTSLSVTSTGPANEADGVGTNVKVVAVFNKSLKSETVTETSFRLHGANETAISGTVSYNAANMTGILDPNSLLTPSTEYTATITTAVKDQGNKGLAENYTWTFTTGAEEDTTDPTVKSFSPADGADGVVRNTKVNVVFSEPIDPETITSTSFKLTEDGGDDVHGTRRYVNPTTVVFSPTEILESMTDYTLSLTSGIKDLAGNGLVPFTLGFTTGDTVSVSPDAVDLGSAGNYVILAKTGVSTTGTTSITGDVAVSPEHRTALTGFSETLSADGQSATSPVVTGKLFSADMDDPTPANLTTAVSDMETAYTTTAGLSDPDFTELGAGEIGGLTLDRGLYKWGTGVLVTSDVTLNGSADDVWIFQIGEDLKLEDGKSIILTGGAQAKNVFWQVAGEVTLQAGATFNGVILGQTAIVAKSGAVINGRALAQSAVTLIANEVTEPAE